MVQDSPVPRPDRQEIAAIAAGGAVGALVRVALARSYAPGPGSWPWVTFAVNLAGAFMLGYFVTRLQERLPLSAYRRPLLGTGFCGALTTFSTMQLELVRMIDRHHYGLAVAYAAASLAAGYACVHLATAVVRRVRVVA
jgi:fluoride exporter